MQQAFLATLYYAPEKVGELEPFVQHELKATDKLAAEQEAKAWVQNRHKPPYKYLRLVVRCGNEIIYQKAINDLN